MEVDSIFERMRGDHARVLAEVGALESTVAALDEGRAVAGEIETALRRAVEMLGRQFGTHMAAQDGVLYPALARALPESLGSLEPLRAEHEELRSLLDSLALLLGATPRRERDEQVAIQLRDLIDLLRIHIRKEEAVVFRVAERVLEPRQLQALADRMIAGAGDVPSRAARGHRKGNPT